MPSSQSVGGRAHGIAPRVRAATFAALALAALATATQADGVTLPTGCAGAIAVGPPESTGCPAADGDRRITSFILWHFVEEFEHRHAMFDVYQEVVGDYWYRLKVARRTFAHVTGLGAVVQPACIACEEPPADDPALPRIPRRRRLALGLGLLETLSPFHDPRRGTVPQWIAEWFAADDAGADMTAVAL